MLQNERWYKYDINKLEEENKKLNIKVASLEWEIKWLNSTIERLHKEIEELEKQPPRFSDFWWYDLDNNK
jgi:predicted RNase H-like nuclease (RuvC/YqgF family)